MAIFFVIGLSQKKPMPSADWWFTFHAKRIFLLHTSGGLLSRRGFCKSSMSIVAKESEQSLFAI